MVAKLFTKPFGVAGDKTPIPNGTQVDGTVSYETGFGADYERQLGVDPAAKNIGRQTFNELMFDATTSLQEMQAGFGTSVYSLALAQALPGGGYPKGALIPRLAGDGFWLCTTTANTSNPDTGGAGWVQVAMPQGSFYAIDTGVANAYSCVFSPALTARSEVQPLTVRIKFTNTGASTINDGLGTVPLVGLAQAALQGGEVAANGIAVLQWVAAISSYVVAYATGGTEQVANATKSLHAVNAGQIQSQSVTAFTTTGTATAQVFSPAPAIASYSATQRFNVTFNVASGLNPTINISGQGAKFLKQYDSLGAKVPAVFSANQNSDIVYDGADWVLLDQLPVTGNLVDTVRANVASATIVDLTSSAPNTRHINITGAVNIAGFAVAAGQCYFVRLDAALQIINGSSLVTQSGGDILTQSGDTCIIRAVAANSVEVLCYTRSAKSLCTAWVSWNGTGTVAVRDSYNVSSITDNGTGDFTVNFATPMSNASYSFSYTVGGSNNVLNMTSGAQVAPTASALRVASASAVGLGTGANFQMTDFPINNVQIFGGK